MREVAKKSKYERDAKRYDGMYAKVSFRDMERLVSNRDIMMCLF